MAMGGLYYEEFSVGMRFEHVLRRTVTEADNLFFSALTHNPAALHLDEEYMNRRLNQRDEEVGVCKRTALMKRKAVA
jgi:acyl dehydratase